MVRRAAPYTSLILFVFVLLDQPYLPLQKLLIAHFDVHYLVYRVNFVFHITGLIW